MGGVVAAMVFKKGNDKLKSEASDAWALSSEDIDGTKIPQLRDLVGGKKAILVTNLAR